MYLEYEKTTKQVVQIRETIPTNLLEGYDYAISNNFKVGDEFELTIWVNSVDKNKNLGSYSAVRNNVHAARLLRENVELKSKNQELTSMIDFILTEVIPPSA